MNNNTVTLTLLILLLFLMSCSSDATDVVAPYTDMPKPTPTMFIPSSTQVIYDTPEASHKLIFDEEFSSAELNSQYWSTEYRWGRTNNDELQYYADNAFEFENGILRIRADQKSQNGKEYVSGLIASWDRFFFTYGYVEIRAKLPVGQGLWPAFWLHLNNDDKTGEIDVFELLGQEPRKIYMTLHFPGILGKSDEQQAIFEGPDYSQDFHTYAVDWQPNSVTWYVDDVQRYRLTENIPHEPMYLIANLAVGGNWPGNPNSTTSFPAYYDIDYIRVDQKK